MAKGDLKFKNVLQAGCLTFLGFVACILPWGIYTYNVWGQPFFSANSLYQFTFYSPYQMATDAWWKLHTPVGKVSNGSLFRNDPMPFLTNWFRFISYNFLGLPAGYFFEMIAGLYALISRWYEKKLAALCPFLIVTGACFFLNLISLGFYVDAGYSPAYLIYVIPVFYLLAADGLYYFSAALQNFLQKQEPMLFQTKIGVIKSPLIFNQRWFLFGFGILLVLALFRKSLSFTQLMGFRTGRIILMMGSGVAHVFFFVFLFFVLAVVVCLAVRRKHGLHPGFLWLGISLAVFVLLTPNVSLRRDAYLSLPKETPSIEILKQITAPDQITLSFNGFYGLPWLTDRKTLGLPEYPDYIYEMIGKYDLPIQSIYLDGAMSWFLFSGSSHWAPSYEIYPILGRIKGVIPGFELVDHRYETENYQRFNLPEIPKEIAVYRRIPGFDFKKLMEPPTQYTANNAEDRIHFVSGFGEVGSIDNIPVIYASDEVRGRFANRPDRLRPWEDSDITFHATTERKPKSIIIDAYFLGETQLYFYLDLDLDIYDRPKDRPRKQVGDFSIDHRGWQKIRITLPKEGVIDGMNKLGFRATVFHSVPVCNLLTDAPTRILVDKMGSSECFKLDGNALPSGVLSESLNANLTDFGVLQKTITESNGTMLIRKIEFEY